MSFTGYEEYKKSGFDWLGEIPKHWKTIPLWTYFRRVKRTGFIDEELLSVYRDHGVILKASRDDNHNRASDDLEPYQLVNIGDLVINKMKAFQGSVAISDYRGIVSPAYFVFEGNHSSNPRFLHYLMRSNRYIFAYLSISNGIRPNQWDLEPQYHSRLPLVIPPEPEQKIIADFLDHETAKIDVLVTEQEKLIELLKEKRQAVISNAVTKGLDPKVELKDSEVEWLGKVPVHWDVVPLKYFVSMKSGEQITSEQIREESAFPVYGGNGLRGYFEKYTHDGEYPLIGRQGALCGNINYANGKFWASEHAVVVTPQKMANIFYLGELLRSMNLGQYSTSAAQPGLSVEAIGNLRIPAPIIEEQNQIADYLLIESGKWESLIEAATQSIKLLQERRSALISAAVTGQIDVRNYQAKESA